MFKFIETTFVAGLLIFAGVTISEKLHITKTPKETKKVETVSYKNSSKEIDKELYPVRFTGDHCHLMDPTYSVKMNGKSEGTIIINNNYYNYTMDKLVYFRNETEPFGFGLTISKDGKSTKMFCHRGRNKLHSWYLNEVRFEESNDAEEMKRIVRSLSENSCHIENHMNVEFAADYASLPIPYENKHKDNNSKESWMEAFEILTRVSSDMKEITKPAIKE